MFAIFKREVRSCFHGTIGYVLTAFLLVASAIYFVALNLGYGLPDFGYYTLYNTIFMLLFYFPVLTMRSFAEERRTRTDQLLLTSPVPVTGIVLGKFFALCVVFALPCVVDAVTILTLQALGRPLPVRWPICGAAVLLSASCAAIAIGVFLSSLTENRDHRGGGRSGGAAAGLSDAQPAQDVHHRQCRGAGVVHRTGRGAQCGGGPAQPQLHAGVFDLCRVLCGAHGVPAAQRWLTEGFSAVLSALCLFAPFAEFVNSNFSIPTLVYYLTVTVLFLFFTVQELEKRRWN